MRRSCSYWLGVALGLGCQVEAAESIEPAEGPLNTVLQFLSPAFDPWDFGGEFRMRLESKHYYGTPGQPGVVDFRDDGGNANNTYLLLREKLHVGYTPEPWITGYLEVRDSSSHEDERHPNAEADTFDLHQGFVRLGGVEAFPLVAKIGRQELSYGDERLIGAFDWNNIGRVFDAAKLRYEAEVGWVDAFVGRVVIPDDNNFNNSNDDDHFSGIYGSTRKLIPKQETQLYFLARNVGEDSPATIGPGLPPILTGASPRDVYTLGLRVKSLPGAHGPWDYSAEMAGQLGKFTMPGTMTSLDHSAFAAHVGGGYTVTNLFGKPRFGLEYNYASGDDDPNDGDHGTFDNLFPTNHKFYGYMDFVSWQNIHNPRLQASFKPMEKLLVTADVHGFWLADTSDFFYQVNGAPRAGSGYGVNPGYSSFVGAEIDLVATYTFNSAMMAQAGYGHFFTGDYIDQSLTASGSEDADWFYLQFTVRF